MMGFSFSFCSIFVLPVLATDLGSKLMSSPISARSRYQYSQLQPLDRDRHTKLFYFLSSGPMSTGSGALQSVPDALAVIIDGNSLDWGTRDEIGNYCIPNCTQSTTDASHAGLYLEFSRRQFLLVIRNLLVPSVASYSMPVLSATSPHLRSARTFSPLATCELATCVISATCGGAGLVWWNQTLSHLDINNLRRGSGQKPLIFLCAASPGMWGIISCNIISPRYVLTVSITTCNGSDFACGRRGSASMSPGGVS